MFIARPGVRARILAIALVPSLVLLVGGVGASGYLVAQGKHAEEWATAMQQVIDPTVEMVRAVQAERQLTLARFAGDESAAAQLAAARTRLDSALRSITAASQPLMRLGLDKVDPSYDANLDAIGEIAKARGAIDAGFLGPRETYALFNQLGGLVANGGRITQVTSPDAEASAELADARSLTYVSEALSRSNAIARATLVSATPFAIPLEEFQYQSGLYHGQIASMIGDPEFGQRARLETLVASPAWQRVSAMESAFVQRALATESGVRSSNLPALPMTNAEWQEAANQINDVILETLKVQHLSAHNLAEAVSKRNTENSTWAGAGVLLVSIGAFVIAILLANRVIRRLRRLRAETMALADERLPDTLQRLRDGQPIDPSAEAPPLDFGHDEIGEVARAFQHAHAAAVEGAVREARTREGVRAVFLNIAHRSQIVVHRQLEILDEAESTQEDPALLDTLFRLDHLATRERRNAENLIILGGGRPGRQWRYPVPLLDLVRSSVGETLDYARVRVGRVPEAHVIGTVVADLVHLLAELVDNATSFSPPQSKVEVTGNVVGKGVVIEITDQGMGMPADELVRTNQMLGNPPDFGVATLSEDSRLGLFVVAQLAQRNNVSVRLSESDYGGVRAIVLIPTALLAGDARPGRQADPVPSEPVRRNGRHAAPAIETAPPQAEIEAPAAVLTAAPPAPPVFAPEPPPVFAPEPPPAPAPTQAAPRTDQIGPDGRPLLPRRRRQANLAPELARDTKTTEPVAERERSAEQARDLMSAIENGTRQGRRMQLADEQEQEGDGDRSQNR
ncbi:sensor histidine kinase [Nocardia bovistercoris]|uniref:histidine kinase n=1 Tax=Nocardia bovistercoris TaxID=2785916 RepID=A0A931N0W2_9NOCA|nr:nitrate- and nitrite sensing domain-containing protein [Nocardia bovistercoris]MBH0777725.1 nitrate- and nitrite sensing domain-containing protein [Nocardia bovistercoris]